MPPIHPSSTNAISPCAASSPYCCSCISSSDRARTYSAVVPVSSSAQRRADPPIRPISIYRPCRPDLRNRSLNTTSHSHRLRFVSSGMARWPGDPRHAANTPPVPRTVLHPNFRTLQACGDPARRALVGQSELSPVLSCPTLHSAL